MTWPTTQVSTVNLDQGTDNPGLARANIKTAVDNINSVVAEFGNVNISGAADNKILKKIAGVWSAGDLPTKTSDLTNDSGFIGIQSVPTNVSQLTNDTGYITNNKSITLSGDVTGSGNTAITATLSNTTVTAGTYGSASLIPQITVDSKGRVITAANATPQLTKYSEPTYTVGTTTGTVLVDWNNGNQQVLNPAGNITLGFTNAPTSGTITVIFNTGAASRSVTFANTAKYAGNVRTVSTTTNTTDMIIATTYDGGSNYLISIVKGFI